MSLNPDSNFTQCANVILMHWLMHFIFINKSNDHIGRFVQDNIQLSSDIHINYSIISSSRL